MTHSDKKRTREMSDIKADQIEKLTRELAFARSKFMQERDHWLRLRDDNSRLLRVIEHLMQGNRFEEVREDLNALNPAEKGAIKQTPLSKSAKEARKPPHPAVLVDAATEHDVPAKNARTVPALRAKGA